MTFARWTDALATMPVTMMSASGAHIKASAPLETAIGASPE